MNEFKFLIKLKSKINNFFEISLNDNDKTEIGTYLMKRNKYYSGN
jgi:hypothetical protein